MVALTAAGMVHLDPEVMRVVAWPFAGDKETNVITVRRVHGERCATYKLEAEKAEHRRAMMRRGKK